jgi:hypothetical protein
LLRFFDSSHHSTPTLLRYRNKEITKQVLDPLWL